MSKFNLEEYEQLLKTLISFQTTEGNTKEFKLAIQFLESYAQANQLILTNYANYLLIEKNNQEPEIEFFTHLDIVPTEGQKWSTNPYQLTKINNKYYGRGVIDDKGPLAAILLLLKNCETKSNIRLFVGFHEETSFECIKEYNRNHQSPKLGIVSDAKFPVIFGEKGSAHFKLRLPKLTPIIDSTNATNTVIASFKTCDKEYIGQAAHSSKSNLDDNSIYKFLQDWYPQQFKHKLEFSEDKLGTTIYNPTTVTTIGNQIEVYFDVRYTNQEHLKQLQTAFNTKVTDMKPAKFCYQQDVVELLLDCYQQITGDYKSIARTSTAGTYSSYLDNTYVFGFASPGEEGNVHLADEHIKVKTVINGYHIYLELLKRLEKEGD